MATILETIANVAGWLFLLCTVISVAFMILSVIAVCREKDSVANDYENAGAAVGGVGCFVILLVIVALVISNLLTL